MEGDFDPFAADTGDPFAVDPMAGVDEAPAMDPMGSIGEISPMDGVDPMDAGDPVGGMDPMEGLDPMAMGGDPSMDPMAGLDPNDPYIAALMSGMSPEDLMALEDSDVEDEDPEIDKILSDLNGGEEEELPPEKSGRKAAMRKVTREYAQLSSTHAVSHIGEAATCRVIVFWGLILFACAGAFGFLFYSTIVSFFRYETSVEIAIFNDRRLFPAVTFCNLNPFKKDQLLLVDTLAALVTIYDEASK